MPIIADYLRDLRISRRSGQAVPETSYFGALETLLNELGRGLKPRCGALSTYATEARASRTGLFRGPSRVWDYTIGGYQIIKKWLSYREADVLERGLTVNEAWHITRRRGGLRACCCSSPNSTKTIRR